MLADQLTQIVKDAYLIMDLNKLRKALRLWRFFLTHGAELFTSLQAAYRTVEEEAMTKKSRNNSGQTETQASNQSS